MTKKQLTLLIILLLSIRFWSFQAIPKEIYDITDVGLIAYFIIYFFIKKAKLYSSMVLRTNIILVVVFAFTSALPAYFVRGQSFNLSFLVLRVMGLWFFYFYLHYKNYSSRDIIKVCTILGVVWSFILVAQQFTYPLAFFYTRGFGLTDGPIEIRNGIYRFMPYRHQYGVFIFVYFFFIFLRTRQLKKLTYSIIGLIGLYVFVTRQYFVSAIFGVLMGVLLSRGKSRAYGYLIILVIGLFCVFNYETLFGAFSSSTQGEINEDNVRFLSYTVFLFQFWSSPFNILFGNGVPHEQSAYGASIKQLMDQGLFQSDVGIVGSLSKYGIFYVINYIVLHVRAIRYKLLPEDLYIRVLIIINISLIALSDFFSVSSCIPFYCLVFYLFDKAVERKKLAMQNE